MIASLRGTVAARTATTVVLDVAGVGYRIHLTPTHLGSLRDGQELSLLTHLVVREDAWTLYGFRTEAELEVFELLLGVSGVGPKSALGVLAELDPEQIARAIADEDVKAFRRVSGIGPKSAGLIIVSLAGRITPGFSGEVPSPPAAAAGDDPSRSEVVAALTGLGYPEKTAEQAVADAVVALGEEPTDTAAVLRTALRLLGRQTGRR